MDHSDLLNYDPPIWEKAVYGVTSILAVFSNLGLCAIIVKEKNAISDKSDILLMLNISIAALLTGAFTLMTPPLVTPEPSLTGTAAVIYCRLIASWFFIIVLAKVSVMTCMLLAIEQWFTVYKPQRYQTTFGRQRAKILMLSIWIISGITTISLVASSTTDNSKCIITTLFETQYVLVLMQTFFTIFFPCFLAWSAVGALLYKKNNLQIQGDMRVRPVCIIVVLTVTLSWFLEEFSAFVQEYVFLGLNSNVRYYCRMIALITPCLVPCICVTQCKECRQFQLLYVRCCSTRADENTTGNNLREDSGNGGKEFDIGAVLPKEKNEIKDGMGKQCFFERENELNHEKDQKTIQSVFDAASSFNDNVYETLVPEQLSTRRDSSNYVREAETSTPEVRYVKQREIATVAMMW